MATLLDEDAVLRLRLGAQRLAYRAGGLGDVVRTVRDLVGLQAQDAAAVALSVHVRTPGSVAGDVERALTRDRMIVRTWLMRGTLHLVTAEDLDWLLTALGPTLAAGGRSRRAQLGLDDDTAERAVRAVRDALAGRGSQSRAEIAAVLAARRLPHAGQATIHVIHLAALQGYVCHGPVRGRDATYVLRDDWLPPAPPPTAREAALAELARRYLQAHEPAGPADLAAWSGLGLREARAAWASAARDATEVQLAGESLWLREPLSATAGGAVETCVRLLPAFDTYLLGWRDRTLAVPAEYARRVNAGGGIIHPTVLVNGRVVATWRLSRTATGAAVTIDPFADLADSVLTGITAEAWDLTRFLGVPQHAEAVRLLLDSTSSGG